MPFFLITDYSMIYEKVNLTYDKKNIISNVSIIQVSQLISSVDKPIIANNHNNLIQVFSSKFCLLFVNSSIIPDLRMPTGYNIHNT